MSAAPTDLTPEIVLRGYFHAKDENRPHILERVFEPDAELVVVNHASTIAFPARTVGRDAITDVLVRNFTVSVASRPILPAAEAMSNIG